MNMFLNYIAAFFVTTFFGIIAYVREYTLKDLIWLVIFFVVLIDIKLTSEVIKK